MPSLMTRWRSGWPSPATKWWASLGFNSWGWRRVCRWGLKWMCSMWLPARAMLILGSTTCASTQPRDNTHPTSRKTRPQPPTSHWVQVWLHSPAIWQQRSFSHWFVSPSPINYTIGQQWEKEHSKRLTMKLRITWSMSMWSGCSGSANWPPSQHSAFWATLVTLGWMSLPTCSRWWGKTIPATGCCSLMTVPTLPNLTPFSTCSNWPRAANLFCWGTTSRWVE